jgi:hypothetical protein
MSLRELTSRQAILDAVAEFDRLGRSAFLSKYGYGVARQYFLQIDNRMYDSKAVVGAAHGFQFPHLGPLKRTEFSGERTVKRKLEELNFFVTVVPVKTSTTT